MPSIEHAGYVALAIFALLQSPQKESGNKHYVCGGTLANFVFDLELPAVVFRPYLTDSPFPLQIVLNTDFESIPTVTPYVPCWIHIHLTVGLVTRTFKFHLRPQSFRAVLAHYSHVRSIAPRLETTISVSRVGPL